MAQPRVLCTGGLGYIGSHTTVQLLQLGFRVLVLDSLSNASPHVEKRIREITNVEDEKLKFFQLDLKDKEKTFELFRNEKIDAVIHFAALKCVGESLEQPLNYYANNVGGTCNLLQAMQEHGVRVFVFSSSATVYERCTTPTIDELQTLNPNNPYGRTKLFAERILQDLAAADPSWRISILRYFNPVGAHHSGLIGEAPCQPNNILPIIIEVAAKRRPYLSVFGGDWETPDGTGVRDYLHVDDLSLGHVAALKHLLQQKNGCVLIHNLGTGKGSSVLELKQAFEKASGLTIPHKIVGRREGDLGCVVADPSLAEKELNWRAVKTVEEACASAWKWHVENPNGYV